MQLGADATADAATAVAQGRRDRQEDAVLADFPGGSSTGFVVLSDGMGGHDAGDMASRIIVTEMFADLCFLTARAETLKTNATRFLRETLTAANDSLRAHWEAGTGARGMGGTVVAAVINGDELNWISVGDSLLYLLRDGKLIRLNEDHSMAPQIDHMAREGIIDPETARTHPQRSQLTSALTGMDIDKIDCPEQALRLRPGDIVLVTSDGLLTLDANQITRVLRKNRRRTSQDIAQALLQAVAAEDAPEQDNVSLAVIRFSAAAQRGKPVQSAQVELGLGRMGQRIKSRAKHVLHLVKGWKTA